jgi:hypothetical protein
MITKQIDGKMVTISIYPDNGVFAQINGGPERIVASMGGDGKWFIRETHWFAFSADIFAPMPVLPDTSEAVDLRSRLFDIVCDAARQIRKEAA